jgi:hypothetical protein
VDFVRRSALSGQALLKVDTFFDYSYLVVVFTPPVWPVQLPG